MKTGTYPRKKPKRVRSRKPKARVQERSVPSETTALREFSDSITKQFYPVSLPTQLFLLNVDPHCLHATWNIRSQDLASKTAKGENLILKVYQQLPGASRDRMILIKELQVNGFENAHYIHSLKGAGVYQAEIGLLDRNRFISIIHSNSIHVPPPKIRTERRTLANWMNPNPDAPPPRHLSLEQARRKAEEKRATELQANNSLPPETMEQSLPMNENTANRISINGRDSVLPEKADQVSSAPETQHWPGFFYLNQKPSF